MGRYINNTSTRVMKSSFSDKCQALIDDGAMEIPKPDEFKENLICVVDNGLFGAAAYCYNPSEFVGFTQASDYRPKRWFIYEYANMFAM